VDRSNKQSSSLERALRQFPYGLYVVGSTEGESVLTIIANWATQVSFSPPLIGIAIEDDSRMRSVIESSGYFSINVLPSGAKEVAKAFAGGHAAGITPGPRHRFTLAPHGTPFLDEASASIECAVRQSHATGDHVMFVGEGLTAAMHREGDVLTLKETGWHYRR